MNSMDELWGLTMRANSGDEFKGTLGMNPGDELLWVGCNISIRAQGLKVPLALLLLLIFLNKKCLFRMQYAYLRVLIYAFIIFSSRLV